MHILKMPSNGQISLTPALTVSKIWVTALHCDDRFSLFFVPRNENGGSEKEEAVYNSIGFHFIGLARHFADDILDNWVTSISCIFQGFPQF